MAVIPLTAQSQTADDTDVVVLDEIVVTARRTEESLLDVPASVSVVTTEDIERSNITTTRQVFDQLPNVNFTFGGTSATTEPSIRGFNNQIGSGATSPSVGVFVDGVLVNPSSSNAAVGQNTADLERVESALGPQNNNFGRGTVGGAVNFVTKKPTETFEFSVEGDIGSRVDGGGTLILNQPLNSDGSTAARLVLDGRASDGFIEIAGDGPDEIGSADFGVRFSVRSRPTERLTLDASFSYDRSEFDGLGFATFGSINDDDPTFPGDSPGEQNTDRFLVRAEIAYEFDAGTLILRGSYLDTALNGPLDTDFTPFDVAVAETDVTQNQFSGEFRFEGNEFDLPGNLGTASVNLGTSISFVDFDTSPVTDPGQDGFDFAFAGTPFAGALDDGSIISTGSEQEVFSFGVFAEARWRPIPRLEIAGGIRFSLDDVETSGETVSTGLSVFVVSPVAFDSGSETFTAFTPNASIKYDWTDNFSTYFSFSTGFRAGGFSSTPAGFDTFDEERATQFEAGFRGSFFDDRLFISGSGFFLEVDDLQVSTTETLGAISFSLDTNADAESVGGEIEVVARPIDGLMLGATWGILFTEFTSFPGDEALVGEPLPASPEHTVNLVGDYQFPVRGVDADAFFRAEYRIQTSFTSFSDPEGSTLSGFDVLNLRIGLRGERFQLVGFVENVLDEEYATGTSFPALAIVPGAEALGVAGPTRRFGLQGRWVF
ncbi:MAG: TonB-dependent receptor [Pseudomonadota bacterium]